MTAKLASGQQPRPWPPHRPTRQTMSPLCGRCRRQRHQGSTPRRTRCSDGGSCSWRAPAANCSSSPPGAKPWRSRCGPPAAEAAQCSTFSTLPPACPPATPALCPLPPRPRPSRLSRRLPARLRDRSAQHPRRGPSRPAVRAHARPRRPPPCLDRGEQRTVARLAWLGPHPRARRRPAARPWSS